MSVAKVVHDVLLGAGAIATGFLATVPDAAMTLWMSSPDFFKAIIPEEYMPVVSGGLTFLVAISRVVQGKKEAKKKEEGAA